MEPLISIVIPVFNVESYLEDCIESVLSQSYDHIEVLLIDDGSTDNSPAICDRYASSDKRVHCYHKNNGGLSSARNYGIERANGMYISLVDSDDYIDERFIEFLYKNLDDTNSDIAISSFQRFNEDGEPKRIKVNNGYKRKVFTKQEAYKALYDNEYKYQFTMACGKLYKTEILRETPFPVGRKYEDTATAHLFISKANRIVFLDRKQYLYRTRKTSITKSEDFTSDDMILSVKEQLEFFEKEEVPCDIVLKSAKSYIIILMGVYSRITGVDKQSKTKKKELYRLVNETIKIYPSIFDGDFVFKIRTIIFRKIPNLYVFIINRI